RNASVFSSCAGKGTLMSACIQAGASPAAHSGTPARQPITTNAKESSARHILLTRSRRAGLQHNLLLISCPHGLIEIAQRRVVFLFGECNPAPEMPLQMERTLLSLDFKSVGNDFCIDRKST